jgi:hypothetical protein
MKNLLLTLAVLLCSVSARAADAKPAAEKKSAAPAMSAEMKAQMEGAKKRGAPSAGHARLKGLEGRWNAKVSMWMKAGDKPMESKGIATFESVFGGRFVRQKFFGEWGGEKFEGQGTIGYDNVRKQYVNTWMDSMSTGLMYSTGQYDEASKSIKDEGTFSCPMRDNASVWFRSEWKLPAGGDTQTYSMYERGEDTKEFKTMEIVYTRAK